jgi:formate C-acetyltransferase
MEFKGFKYRMPNSADINGVNVMTPRLQKLKKEWEAASPTIYVDDTLLFTESWKETDGLPLDYRWAKAFEKRMMNCPLLLRDGEIIVGSTTKFIRGSNTLCAMKPLELLGMIESGNFAQKNIASGSSDIDPEDLEKLRQDAHYWKERRPEHNFVLRALEEDMGDPEFLNTFFDRACIFEGRAPRVDPDRGLFQGFGAFAGSDVGPTAKVINSGLNHVIEFAEAELEKMRKEGAGVKQGVSNASAWRKYWFIKAMIVTCKALIGYAKRYSDLASAQAAECTDPTRKAELLQIADICENVPGNPPRSYWEAMQAFRFLHMGLYKESPERPAVPIGPLDNILYHYYEKDMKEGKLTRQFAAELLGALWLKTRENEAVVTIRRDLVAAPGTLLPNVTICGIDENGLDMTNEMSWLILEIMRQTMLSEPTIYIRYHNKMDRGFMIHALECNRDFGGGNPAFLNDALGTQRYLDRGVPASDACHWSASGCLGYHMDRAQHMAGNVNIHHPKILEVTLNDGIDPRTGLRCAPALYHIKDAKSLEDVIQAFEKYEDYFCDKIHTFLFQWWGAEDSNAPMSSYAAMLNYEDTIPVGLGLREGASPYNVCRAHWLGDRGMTDVTDSFAGLKYVVFDKQLCTLEEMIKALNANWRGYEQLQMACRNAPKFGNDDDYVDEIFARLSIEVQDIMQSRPDPYTGEKLMLFKGAAAGHIAMGRVLGAMPNGRKAGESMNDAATSAGPGMDVNGPTANINSATVAPVAYEYCGCTHNMKFQKSIINTPEKLEKFIGLVDTFCRRGGWHIQFNMLSNEELMDARKNPDKHRDLLVRVGGYSAFYVDLPQALQDEIITRTMHTV